jgi:hypothetical protein
MKSKSNYIIIRQRRNVCYNSICSNVATPGRSCGNLPEPRNFTTSTVVAVAMLKGQQ